MKLILQSVLASVLFTFSSAADDTQQVNSLIQGYFKSKEQGDNLWFGNNLSSVTVEKIRRMFNSFRNSADESERDQLPDFSNMSGGEIYQKLVELGRGKTPNMGQPWTGAEFRLIGILDDGDETKYAMYEASWSIEDSAPIRKVSYFKMEKEGDDWKIGLLGDVDRAIDLQLKRMNSSKN
jgi:hypothetical protein